LTEVDKHFILFDYYDTTEVVLFEKLGGNEVFSSFVFDTFLS